MPIFIYTHYCECNNATRLLGVVQASQRTDFVEQLHILCKAKGWGMGDVSCRHEYLNSITDDLRQNV